MDEARRRRTSDTARMPPSSAARPRSSPIPARGRADSGAPPSEVGVVGWVRKNLFSSLTNTVLTHPRHRTDRAGSCRRSSTGPSSTRCGPATTARPASVPGTGACWAFVEAKFGQFMYGRYPIDERWRVNLIGDPADRRARPDGDSAGALQAGERHLPARRLPDRRAILLTGGNFAFPGGFVGSCC